MNTSPLKSGSNEINELNVNIDKQEKSNKDSENKITKLSGKISTLKNENVFISDKIVFLTSRHDEGIENVDQLERVLNTNLIDLSNVNAKILHAESNIKKESTLLKKITNFFGITVKQNLQEQKEFLHSAKLEYKNLRLQYHQNSQELKTLQEITSLFKETLPQLKGKLDTNNEKIENKSSTYSELKAGRDERETTLSELESKRDLLQEQLAFREKPQSVMNRIGETVSWIGEGLKNVSFFSNFFGQKNPPAENPLPEAREEIVEAKEEQPSPAEETGEVPPLMEEVAQSADPEINTVDPININSIDREKLLEGLYQENKSLRLEGLISQDTTRLMNRAVAKHQEFIAEKIEEKFRNKPSSEEGNNSFELFQQTSMIAVTRSLIPLLNKPQRDHSPEEVFLVDFIANYYENAAAADNVFNFLKDSTVRNWAEEATGTSGSDLVRIVFRAQSDPHTKSIMDNILRNPAQKSSSLGEAVAARLNLAKDVPNTYLFQTLSGVLGDVPFKLTSVDLSNPSSPTFSLQFEETISRPIKNPIPLLTTSFSFPQGSLKVNGAIDREGVFKSISFGNDTPDADTDKTLMSMKGRLGRGFLAIGGDICSLKSLEWGSYSDGTAYILPQISMAKNVIGDRIQNNYLQEDLSIPLDDLLERLYETP